MVKRMAKNKLKKRPFLHTAFILIAMIFSMAIIDSPVYAADVCQIGTTKYSTLEAAVTAATDGSTITMLVSSYTAAGTINATGSKHITITGLSGSTTITRSSTDNSLLSVSGGATVNLDHLTLNGNSTAGAAVFVNVSGAGSVLNLNQNTVITNFNTTSVLWNVYVQNQGVLNMNANSKITGCTGFQGAAITCDNASAVMSGTSEITGCTGINSGVVDLRYGASFTMQGSSSVHGNTGTATSSAFFLRNATANTLVLKESSTVTGNHATGTGYEADTICCHVGGGQIIIGDNASISGNTSASTVDGAGGAIRLPKNCTLTMTGGSITGNTVASGGSGGVYALAESTVNVSGTAQITGNKVGTAARNLYLQSGVYVKAAANLSNPMKIGITAAGTDNASISRMAKGGQFGTTATAAASSTTGLSAFFADTNTGAATDLFGSAGTGSAVVWNTATCQIIRGGACIGFYATLAEACAAAASGDAIEVFRSHSSPAATVPSGGSISTASAGTATVAGAMAFQPVSGETDRAKVSRMTDTAGKANPLITGGTATVSKLILDGASVSATKSLIQVNTGATLTLARDVTVQNAITASASYPGGIDVQGTLISAATITGCRGNLISAIMVENNATAQLLDGTSITGNVATFYTAAYPFGSAVTVGPENGGLTLSGQVNISGNTNSGRNNTAANVYVNSANGTIAIKGALGAGSLVGISVYPDSSHVSGHDFVKAYEADGTTPSEAAATASAGFFRDDRTPALAIAANGTTAGNVSHSARIYFDDGHIQLVKNVAGNYGDKSRAYPVTVTYTPSGGTAVANTYSVVLETPILVPVPVGATYAVTEPTQAGYSTVVTVAAPSGSTENPAVNGAVVTSTAGKAVGLTIITYTNTSLIVQPTGIADGHDFPYYLAVGLPALAAGAMVWLKGIRKKFISK